MEQTNGGVPAKKKNVPFAAVAVLVLLAALMLGLWAVTAPRSQAGSKSIVVEVVHGDASTKEFRYTTDAGYLGEVLSAEGLVKGEEGAYGLFITEVDGEAVQGNQWWCITKDGQRLETGADSTPIADGDHFELTLSVY